MPSIGPLELAIILVIVLVIFGPKRLPGLGRQLGSGMREFKDSLTKSDRDRDEIEDEDEDEDDARDDARRRRELHDAPAHEPHGTPAREPEVVTGEARPEDQPASRTDS
jgi:sec-independent protein translocase protein TatA